MNNAQIMKTTMTNEQAQLVVAFIRDYLLAGNTISASGDRVLEALPNGDIYGGMTFTARKTAEPSPLGSFDD
jgi:hypothetical protein